MTFPQKDPINCRKDNFETLPSHTIKYDIIEVTDTWLSEGKTTNIISLAGYELNRKDKIDNDWLRRWKNGFKMVDKNHYFSWFGPNQCERFRFGILNWFFTQSAVDYREPSESCFKGNLNIIFKNSWSVNLLAHKMFL